MTCLGDFPACRIAGGREDAENLQEILVFLDATEEDWVVMIDEAVDVAPRTWALPPEPLICARGLAQFYPASNSLTSLESSNGVLLCQREQVLALGNLPGPEMVMPVFCGIWDAAPSPERAFDSGFRHGQMRHAEAAGCETAMRYLAFEASMGAHHQFGAWWMLGVLSGCCDGQATPADWETLADLDAASLNRAVRDLARRVRMEGGPPVAPLSPEASQWALNAGSNWPSLPVWEGFADRCVELGEEGARLAAAYRAAGRRIWAARAPYAGAGSEARG